VIVKSGTAQCLPLRSDPPREPVPDLVLIRVRDEVPEVPDRERVRRLPDRLPEPELNDVPDPNRTLPERIWVPLTTWPPEDR
jgi:hypothetical protein